MDYKRKVRLGFKLLPLLVLFLAAGCATCGHIIEDFKSGPRSRESLIYAGTKYHLHEIPLYRTRNRMHWGDQLTYSLRWWHYVDLPLCVCADTLLLPYTVLRTWYTHWKDQPTKEETAMRPFIEEYSTCIRNMRDLEFGKLLHAQRHGLGPTEDLPQDLEVYRAQVDVPYNRGPFYVCPAGGAYVVGGQSEEPACSVHGTPSEAMQSMEFMCKEKRLPDGGVDIKVYAHGQQKPIAVIQCKAWNSYKVGIKPVKDSSFSFPNSADSEPNFMASMKARHSA